MSSVLRGSGWQFEEILSSPLVRAQETASILHEGLGGSPSPRVADFLAPGVTPESVLTELEQRNVKGALLWVFHMPDLASVAAQLLGVQPSSLYITPGTTLALNLSHPFRPGRAMLVWAIQPEYLTALSP